MRNHEDNNTGGDGCLGPVCIIVTGAVVTVVAIVRILLGVL